MADPASDDRLHLSRAGGPAPGPTAAPPPDAGGIAFGRYRLLAPLGTGGMGVVWKAWDPELGRLVALKQLKDELGGGGEAVERFLREARLASKLRHPNVVAVHDVGTVDGHHYITMDYVVGGTLGAWLETTRAAKRAGARAGLDRLRREIELLAAVADAVACAHREGVIHRDLKPGNVLVDAAERPFVMDFGLAKEVVAEAAGVAPSGAGPLTVGVQLLGTPAYMSPEQATGDQGRVGPRTDVWALGAMLYEVLTGSPPFEGATVVRVLAAVAREDPQPPGRRLAGVPRELEAVCLKALEKDPARRYAAAGEFAEELRRWLAGEPVRARRPGPADRAWRWVARRRVPVAAGLSLALALAGAFGWVRSERTHREAQRRATLAEIAASVGEFESKVRSVEMSGEAQDALAQQPFGLLNRLIAADADFGPAWSWRGRVREILGDPAAAQADYDRGCVLAPDQPVVWFLRGVSRIARYAEARGPDLEVAHFGSEGTQFTPAVEPAPAVRRMRDDGLADLDAMMKAQAQGEAMSAPDVRLARATAAFYANRTGGAEEALRLLAGGTSPAAALLRGQVLHHLQRFAEGVAAYDVAVAAWPQYGNARYLRGVARLSEGWRRLNLTQDPSQEYRRAIEDLGETLRRPPLPPRIFLLRGVAWQSLGLAQTGFGGDPTESYQKAAADLEEHLRRSPDDVSALTNHALVDRSLGLRLAALGQEPWELFGRAIADCDAILGPVPGHAQARITRADAYRSLADAAGLRGRDPRASYRKAIADYDEYLRHQPDSITGLNNRAMAWRGLASAEGDQGVDARALFERAIADATEAIRHAPQQGELYNTRGTAWEGRGKVIYGLRGFPQRSYAHAVADYQAAADRQVRGALLNLGRILQQVGRHAEAIEVLEEIARVLPAYAAWAREGIDRSRNDLPGMLAIYVGSILGPAQSALRAGPFDAVQPNFERTLAAVARELCHMPADLKRAWLADPRVRASLAASWYHFARLESLRAAGRAAEIPPLAPEGGESEAVLAPPTAPTARAAHCEIALLHLLLALDFGFKDVEAARHDPDLACVRADPRFEAILRMAR